METEQPVLIILTPGFPKDEADTSCLTSQQNFVRAINKIFPAVRVIVLSFQYPFIETAYTWNGNKVIAFNGRNRGNIFRLLLWRKVLKELKVIHTNNEVTGLFSFWCGECALTGNRFAKRYDLKHFCWILGQDAKKENSYVRRINPPAGELIAMSDFLVDEFFSSHSIRPATVIPNGIDTGLFTKTNTGRDIDILGVGSLIPLKQYDVFIRIMKEIKKQFPNIKAMLCGNGPEEKSLKDLIDENGLNDTISMPGELAHEEVLRLMQCSKILLHPSAYEGFSTVCLEALYAGCRVISFVQPMKKDIEHWHVAKNKEDMLQECMDILQNDPVDHNPVLPYLIEDSAIAVMKLFGYQ